MCSCLVPSSRNERRPVCALGRALLASVVIAILVGAGRAEASERRSLRWITRRLQDADTTPPPSVSNTTASPANVTTANVTSALNATAIDANATTNSTLLANATSPPPHTETAKEKLEEKWEALESKRTPAEKGVAITIGVLMLVCIMTCLVCCVFRRGGQWRVPGMQWFKKKFGPKERYSRYADNDDGF